MTSKTEEKMHVKRSGLSFEDSLMMMQGEALVDERLSYRDKCVLMAISTLTFKSKRQRFDGLTDTLAGALKMPRRSLQQSISALVEFGYIMRKGTPENRFLHATFGGITGPDPDFEEGGCDQNDHRGVIKTITGGCDQNDHTLNNSSHKRSLNNRSSFSAGAKEHDSDHVYVEAVKKMCGVLFSGAEPVLNGDDLPHIVIILKAMVEESVGQGSKGYPTHKAQSAVTMYLEQRKQAERLTRKAGVASNSRDMAGVLPDGSIEDENALRGMSEAQVLQAVRGMSFQCQDAYLQRWKATQKKTDIDQLLADIKTPALKKGRRVTW